MICFEIPICFRIELMYATKNQQVILDNIVDTALIDVAEAGYERLDGNVRWNKEKIVNAFFENVRFYANLSKEAFPVILFRDENEIAYYCDDSFNTVVCDNDEEVIDTIKKTVEMLICKSTACDKSLVSVDIPVDDNILCNTIGKRSILVVMCTKNLADTKSRFIYSVSGVSLVGKM